MQRDLWTGADVRVLAQVRSGGRVVASSGDAAVVVDAGGHHVPYFGTLWLGPSVDSWPAGRGVVVRLDDGTGVRVPRRDLELVAPDHPLAPESDQTHASWWLERLAAWKGGRSVGSLVPASFPAVCQVLHPWLKADRELVRWRELAASPELDAIRADYQTAHGAEQALANRRGLQDSTGELDAYTAAALVDVLGGATTTPDDVFVAVWHGWGDTPPQRFPGATLIPTESRWHFLLRGPLSGVLSSVSASPFERLAAGLWWPADRAWFVATEIDFPWTFIAGDARLITKLVNDERVEAVESEFDAPMNHPPTTM